MQYISKSVYLNIGGVIDLKVLKHGKFSGITLSQLNDCKGQLNLLKLNNFTSSA